jgi:hypothetical protein
LPTTIVFDHPNAVELAKYLRSEVQPEDAVDADAPSELLELLTRLENTTQPCVAGTGLDDQVRLEVLRRLSAIQQALGGIDDLDNESLLTVGQGLSE